jgi:hypothetical protein
MPDDTPRDADAERPISAIDWRFLVECLRTFGPSTDGSVERDLIAAVERGLDSRDAALRAEQERVELLSEEIIAMRKDLDARDAAEPDGWRLIDNFPSAPMTVELYFGNYPSEVVSKDEPYRDSRRRIAYFDGNAFRDTGTGHEVFESWWMTADMRPTQWRPLPPPPAASQEGESPASGGANDPA